MGTTQKTDEGRRRIESPQEDCLRGDNASEIDGEKEPPGGTAIISARTPILKFRYDIHELFKESQSIILSQLTQANTVYSELCVIF